MAKEELHNFIKNPLTSSQAAGNKKYVSQRFDNEEQKTLSEIEAEKKFYNSEWTVLPPVFVNIVEI